jgi:hypothetical protein
MRLYTDGRPMQQTQFLGKTVIGFEVWAMNSRGFIFKLDIQTAADAGADSAAIARLILCAASKARDPDRAVSKPRM